MSQAGSHRGRLTRIAKAAEVGAWVLLRMLFSFAFSFLPSFFFFHHSSLSALLVFPFLALVVFFVVQISTSVFSVFPLSPFSFVYDFRDIYILGSGRKKELGFPMSGS